MLVSRHRIENSSCCCTAKPNTLARYTMGTIYFRQTACASE